MKNLLAPGDDREIIFVFGSNEGGRHGAGAAWFAHVHKGAVWGVGNGLTGQSYAIPTKDRGINFMPLTRILPYVKEFVKFSHEHEGEYVFQITQIGCGLAGHTAQSIAPLFRDCLNNCLFDTAWQPHLPESFKFWGTYP